MRFSKSKKIRSFVLLIITAILGTIFLCLGFKKCDDKTYAYRENNSVNYKVYLKQNNFFDTPYLEKNKTYITSLIDYIDSSFSYNVDFSNAVDGTINYQLIAEIKADKENNNDGNYWTKQFTLTELKTATINNKTNYIITVQENIDYNKYNDLMNSFISEFKLKTEASLNVYLYVTGNVSIKDTEEKMDIDSKVSLTIPLSKLAIEGKIDVSNSNIEKEIVRKDTEAEKARTNYRIVFLVILFMFCHYLLQCILIIKYRSRFFSYRRAIKKICSNYDGIITRVKEANTSDYININVENFDDLVNVYNNIKEPINFKYDLDKSIFFIINNNSCYIYTMIKEDFEKDEKK